MTALLPEPAETNESERPSRALDAVLLAVFLSSAVITLGPTSDVAKTWIGGPIESLALLAAAALGYLVSHAMREVLEVGRSWRLFATGLLLFGVGEGWDAFYEISGASRGFPAPPDFVYLAAYVLTPWALIGFLRTYRSLYPVSSSRELKLTILGVVVALAGLAVLVVGPVLQRPLPLSERIFLVCYVVIDIALLAPLALLVRTVYAFRGGAVARAWSILLAGFLGMQAADLLFSLSPWLEATAIFWTDQVLYAGAYLVIIKGIALHRELIT